MAAQIENRLTDRLHAPNGLHGYIVPRVVPHLYLDGPVGTLVIKLQDVNQLGFAVQPAASDRHLAAGAELIIECRLRSVAPRVIARSQPLVVNLCSYTGFEHGRAATRRQLIRSILRVHRQGQLVVRQLLGRARQGDNQRASERKAGSVPDFFDTATAPLRARIGTKNLCSIILGFCNCFAAESRPLSAMLAGLSS